MQRNRIIVFALIGIVAALSGALIARAVFRSGAMPFALQSGTILQPARSLPAFALTDQTGNSFGNEQLRGHWSLLFFGFTNCGDVCPTTLALLATTGKKLGDLPDAQRPRIVFVSVDARRDTPETVRTYIRHFDANMTGLTGKQQDLDAFTMALGVPSAIRETDNGGFTVDHSAAILAVNPNGEFKAIFSPPHTVDALASDYRLLLGEI